MLPINNHHQHDTQTVQTDRHYTQVYAVTQKQTHSTRHTTTALKQLPHRKQLLLAIGVLKSQ